jgi:hypothetical protein
MFRHTIRAILAAACVAGVSVLGSVPAHAALIPPTSCTGSIHTSLTDTGATVSGSATCTGLATLNLTTTVTANGVTSTITNLLPALPNIPLPIATTVPAVDVSAACSVLVNTANGALVSASCSA